MEHKEKFRKDFARNISLGVLSMAGQSLFILADTFFIANGVGAEGLAALNIVLPVVNIFNGLGWMVGIGGGTLFATSLGKGELNKANSYFSFTTVFASIIGLLFILFSWLYSHQILSFLGASGEIYILAKEYYDIIATFSVFFILNNMFITFLRNDHNPKLAMIAFSSGGLLNIVLDYIFIFPFDMGMAGAAWASIISPIASLAILSLHIKNPHRELMFTKFTRNIKTAGRILALGFSSFLNEFSSALIMFLFNIVLLQLVGNIAVSAYAVIANMNIIAIAIFTGIGQGMQPLISINYGARNYDIVKKTLKYGLITASITGAIFFLCGLLFSPAIVGIFNGDNNEIMAAIAESGVRIYFASFLFTGINFILIFFTASIGKSRLSLIISLLRGLVLIIPILYVMKNVMGVTGVWITMPIVELLTLLVGVFVLFYLMKKTPTRLN